MRFPFGVTVTIVRKPAVDAYGDPIAGTATRIDIPLCAVAPRTSTEPTERGRQGVIVGKSVYLPDDASTIPLFTDQLEIAGVLYDIEGEPGEWSNPLTGWAPGTEIAIRRA